MDKISFTIPTNTTTQSTVMSNTITTLKQNTTPEKKTNNISDNISDDIKISPNTITTLQQNKTPEKKTNNITDNIKIAPNVYIFGSNDLNVDNDIYVLYSNACQVKKENKYSALEMFKKCHKLINNNTKNDVKYEIYINLALLVSELEGTSDEVGNYYEESLKVYSDRAEPYYYWSIYCNRTNNFEQSYKLLHQALLLSYEDAVIKYPETQFSAYGKYLYDELSVAASWLKKYEEARTLMEQIINDPDFSESKERFQQNMEIIKNGIENI